MKLTDDDIQEFTEIWRRDVGDELTSDQARHEALLLLELYWILAQPLPGTTVQDGVADEGRGEPR